MNLLGIEELIDLEESIRTELDDNLTTILTKLNRAGQLEELLELMGLTHLLNRDTGYQVYKSGKIVVIGQSDVRQEALLAIGKKLGIDKDRFEFYLEYEDAKSFNFKKMQWQPSYSVVLVGPMPHSGLSKGDYSSVITAIESEEGYPRVIRLGRTSLKITKSDFKEKLEELIKTGAIV